VSRSDWDDDEQSRPAPLPAHEREWRHPSEFGQQQWMVTEPPLAIGRGLTAATGAVGGLLALAVLWTMVPTEAGRSADSSVRSTLASRATSGISTEALAGTGDFDTVPDTIRPLPSTTAAVATTRPPAGSQANAVTTVSSVPRPIATYSVVKETTLEEGSVAVAVNGGTLVITTANAVSADLTVDLLLPDGTAEQARVLFVDTRSGLAVLAPETVSEAEAFTVGTEIAPGDQLTFLGTTISTVTVTDEMAIDAAWADTPHAEGTPVVNQRGELVALCTHDADDAAKLVPLSNLDELQQAIASFKDSTKVWLGIILNDDPAGEVMVGAVDRLGPAGVAGIEVGDLILGVDGVAVTSTAELSAELDRHLPGEVVTVSVQRSDGKVDDVSITLGAPRPAL
jgi:S1-C subfamily serine protease